MDGFELKVSRTKIAGAAIANQKPWMAENQIASETKKSENPINL